MTSKTRRYGQVIITISMDPKVVKALDHYIKLLCVSPAMIPGRFGRSSVITNMVRRDLRRHGYDPEHLDLIGGK